MNDANINRKVVELIARAGADAWFTPEADAVLPADEVREMWNNQIHKKKLTFSDVWFESGSSFACRARP